MTVRRAIALREEAFAARFAELPDPRDRLELLLAAPPPVAGIPPEERRDEQLVPGCKSRLWVDARWPGGRLDPRADSDSVLVGALARVICSMVSGAQAEEVATHEMSIIGQLGLDRILSPTRLEGLANLSARLRSLAVSEIARRAASP